MSREIRIGTRALVQANDTKRFALVCKRYPNYSDLPGGMLEPNESFEDCIRREVKEELGCEISSELLLEVGNILYQFRSSETIFAGKLFLCSVPSQQVCKAEEGYFLSWATIKEILDSFSYAPSIERLVTLLNELRY